MDTASLKHLQGLNLTSLILNFKEEMPIEICDITNLKALFIIGYNQKFLPENIGNLQNLEQIVIGADDLLEIPESFCNLKNLKSANFLTLRKLTSIPNCFTKLENLEFLAFESENKLVIPPLKNIKCIRINDSYCPEFMNGYLKWMIDWY